MTDKTEEILLEVTDDALLVANSGRPFSHTGVISVCAYHLSDKQSTSDVERYSCSDAELVRKIRDIWIKTYLGNPNLIVEDSYKQDETKRDYGGRFVWELLQNADDSIGQERQGVELIGSKGLGFKSVLEISDEPEVHSGPFHFLFSPTRTQKLLTEKGLRAGPLPLTFRIPHECEPDPKTCELLKAGYATVIRLPFRNEEARGKATESLCGLSPLFLLLSQRLSCVHIRTPEGETIYEATRRKTGPCTHDITLSSLRPNGFESTGWRRWWAESEPTVAGRLSVAVCLPLNEAGKAVPYGKSVPFHVFFPTNEQSGARALVHASFDLEQNRKHVRRGEHDGDVRKLFGELFCKVLKDVPARTALESFGEITPGEGDSPLERLGQTIRGTLKKTPFVRVIGGGRATPGEVRLWKDRLGFVLREDVQEVRDARLLVPELRDLGDILEDFFCAQEVEDEKYIRLLRHCRNDSLEACLSSSLVLVLGGLKRLDREEWHREELLEVLRKVACWWVETGSARALDGHIPLLRARPKDWPNWLPADALHPKMRKMLERLEKWDGKPDTQALFSGRLLQQKGDFLRHVLLPFVQKWDVGHWEADGWRALRQVLSWERRSTFEDTSPWIEGANDQRDQVAKSLCLPTDKGWLPAGDCYAGEAWGGPAVFDRFFRDVEGRGIVCSLDEWPEIIRGETDKDEWKPLLRWVGVSWEPKVRHPHPCFLTPDHDLLDGYKEDLGYRNWSKPWERNWEIEHFPQCVENGSKPADMIKMMLPLAETMQKLKAVYYYHVKRRRENFACYQLKHEQWLPCRRALLYEGERAAPSEAFLPGKGLGGLLPEVDKTGIDDEEWYKHVQGALIDLGVQENLPKDAEGFHEWMRKLSQKEYDSEALEKAAKELYRRYLGLDDCQGAFPQDIHIPCWGEEENLTFSPPDEVFHVDRPYLDEVRREILQKGYKLFIIPLSAGAAAPDRLGVRILSQELSAEPNYESKDEEGTERLRKRYAERRVGLGLAADLKEVDKTLPEGLSLSAVRGLHLQLNADNGDVAKVEVLSWLSKEEDTLLINLDKNEWRALGNGLAVSIAKKEDKASLFENLLSEDKEDEYLDRLRHAGVSEDDIRHAETTFAHEPDEERVDSPNSTTGEPPETGPPPQPIPNDDVPSGQTTHVPQGTGAHDGGARGVDNGQTTRVSERGGGMRGSERSGGGVTSNGIHQAPSPESGRAAEDWLQKQLETAFPSRVERHHRDDKNRESDFVIKREKGELHIEVKHAAKRPGTLFWSGLEYEKARDMEGATDKRYVMALLFPDEEQGYEIRWLWDPLYGLKEAAREVRWEGESSYEDIPTDSWNVTERRPANVPTKRYNFRITLKDEMLETLDRDTKELEALRQMMAERF